ncbi:MAG: hypothetical protein WB780_03900 [Candidatus Acidiferrales bacterium]
MLEIDELIVALSKARPVFHSEADFQHSFAWQLHLQHPTAQIRLETVFSSALGRLHLDMFCQIADQSYAFELKYKTRAASITLGQETFRLQNHGAQPLGRYDFLRDLMRLEAVTAGSQAIRGYAILLTNDSAYWCNPRGIAGTSDAFSLHDGRVLSGELNWSARASTGTKRNREEPIRLTARYSPEWRDYSNVDVRDYSAFRYVSIPVAAG